MKNLLITLSILTTTFSMQAQSLAERLGYKNSDRILIINNDDAGMSHASNLATIEGMEKGIISTSTIMGTCPWFNEIATYAKNNPKRDFGVHLTLTAEWTDYRWGTVASRNDVPGLYDPQGYMWPGVADVYKSSNPEEALIEGRAQIKKALEAGVPVTHIDSHMGTYQVNPLYLKIYLQLAKEFDLPARMPSQATCASIGYSHVREEFTQNGIIIPDYFIHEEFANYTEDNVEEFWTNYIKNIKPGVTEIYVHASKDGEELRAITNSAKTRVKELSFFTSDKIKQLIQNEGIIVIGYRPLFELQRKK